MRGRIYPLRGGAPSLVGVEATLADLLKERGVRASDAAPKASTLVERAGLDRVAEAVKSKDPWYKVKNIATEVGLVLIPLADRARRGKDWLVDNDPWKKKPVDGSGAAGSADSVQKIEVDLSYFAVDDQAPGEISIDDLFAGRPGICVCQAADAAGFLQTIAQRTVSEEASALLVIGELQGLSAWAQDKVTSLVVPVRVGGRPAAATAALFQTGDVPLAIPKQVSVSAKDDNAAKVTTLTFQVVVKLAQELPKPMTIRAYLKHLGLESHFLIQEVWSTGWFCKGKKCPETQADYYHGFMKFPDDRLSKLLRFSGRAGFFCNPRDASRGPDKRYKVIPVGGLQCSEALVKLRDFPQHAGLVKAKQGFGIRVPLAHYQAAKELFTPGAPQSSDSEVDGPRRFFVMGVPRSVDRSRLKSVLKEFHWKAEVIKSTGVQTWLVRASAPPPARAFQLDGVSVLIFRR